jgi:subfamily B ATP-binding cassette protein HlyB/CyaB
MEAASPETALQCLVAVARHHGIDLSIDRIKHDYLARAGGGGGLPWHSGQN